MISLGHVNVRTTKLDESVAFYRDVLGLTPGPAATRPDSDDHVWMSDSNGNPCVHLQRGSALASGDSGAVHHFAFNCDDADAWRSRLAALGVEHDEREFAAARMIQFNLRDPNGVLIELTFGPIPA
jgi:catechol 2,3-dioxygenase-like lactoylglutathione lyase family enzyme